MVTLFRHFHEHPEWSFEQDETTKPAFLIVWEKQVCFSLDVQDDRKISFHNMTQGTKGDFEGTKKATRGTKMVSRVTKHSFLKQNKLFSTVQSIGIHELVFR